MNELGEEDFWGEACWDFKRVKTCRCMSSFEDVGLMAEKRFHRESLGRGYRKNA